MVNAYQMMAALREPASMPTSAVTKEARPKENVPMDSEFVVYVWSSDFHPITFVPFIYIFCIFPSDVANCNETISNNITYLVSPSFPSFMPNNITNCNLKIKLMNDDISQLRFDFYHFILGQPNRRTGVCDGDAFNISGGPGGTFSLCGQNSGQHGNLYNIH